MLNTNHRSHEGAVATQLPLLRTAACYPSGMTSQSEWLPVASRPAQAPPATECGRANPLIMATWLSDEPFSDVVTPLPLQPDPRIVPQYARDYDSGSSVLTQHLHSWVDGRNAINGNSQQDAFHDREPTSLGGTPTSTPTGSPTATPTPTATATASVTPSPSPTATPVGTATPRPRPHPTPRPRPTPRSVGS